MGSRGKWWWSWCGGWECVSGGGWTGFVRVSGPLGWMGGVLLVCFWLTCVLGKLPFRLSFLGWLLWWRACSGYAVCVVSWAFCSGEPCRAVPWRAGGGGGLILPALAKSAPPSQPTPPSCHDSLRCVWVRRQQYRASLVPRCIVCPLVPFSFSRDRIPVQTHTGSHRQGVSRSDNLCSQCAEDGSPLETGAERRNVTTLMRVTGEL